MAGKRVLVVKLSSLGDILHVLPSVHGLRSGLNAEIDWVTQPEYVDLVRCFPDVTDVIPFPRRGVVRGFAGFWKLVRQRQYDLVVDLQGLLKSVLVARVARGAKVIGPSFCREGSRCLYDAVAGPRDRRRHAVEEAMDVVRYLGLPIGPLEFPVVFPRVTVPSGRPRVALIPASRWRNKNWPVEYYAEVTRRLMHQDGARVFLFGGMHDRAACEAIQDAVASGQDATPVINMAGQTRLSEMGSWLQEMDLVVGNDSGPVHIAAALDVPVLALFGPTDPRRTGPYGGKHRVLISDRPCRPCLRRSCRSRSADCMRGISPDQVYEEARAMLKGREA